MDTQDILNNFEFRIIKKKLKQEYPFVIDIQPIDRHQEYNALLFTNVIIDINKFLEYNNIKISPRDKRMWAFFGDPDGLTPISNVFFNFDNETIKNIEDKIGGTMKKIHRSPAIPTHLKLNRTPDISRLLATGEVDDQYVDN